MRKHIGKPGERSHEIGATLCGRSAALLTPVDESDCARCLTVYRSRQEHIRGVTWDEAFREILAAISGPAVEPYPQLTPTLWREMRCRAGAKFCSCAYCEIDKANKPGLEKWKEDQQSRVHRRYAYPFGSVNAALEALSRWREDGAATRSNHGNLILRAQETAKLGAVVQTTQRFDREDLVIRRATYAADIDLALRRAFHAEELRQGLTVAQCGDLLLATVSVRAFTTAQLASSYELSEEATKKLISRGRLALTIELAACDYIPSPRDRSGKITKLIEAKRSERGSEDE